MKPVGSEQLTEGSEDLQTAHCELHTYKSITLPKGWVEVPVSSTCEHIRGVSYNKKDVRFEIEKDYLPLLRANNINGAINHNDLQYVPKKIVKEKQLLQKGDVVIAMSSGSKKVVGKTAPIIQEWQGTFGAFCGVLRPIGELENGLFPYYFRTQEYRNKISELATGTNINNIKTTHFDEINIPLPPLNEQKRIVAKLDAIIPRIDSVKARLDKVPTLIKRFRQSVLTAAVTGKLTEKWREEHPDVESAEVSVKSIYNRRIKECKTTSQKEKVEGFFSEVETEDNSLLPETWQFTYLNKICESFQYGTSSKSSKTGKVAVLRMGNLQNGKIDWSNLAYTSDMVEIKKYRLEKNTVLFNRTNSPELVGKTSIYWGEQEAIFAGYLIKVNNLEILDSHYLNFALNTNYAKAFCSMEKTDGVSQSNINAQKLGRC